MIAVADHDGDLRALAGVFVDELRSVGGSGRRDVDEAMLSHLADLGRRLAGVGLAPSGLATAEVLADPKVTRRAREKVLRQSYVPARAATPAMIDTPRRSLSHRARYGHWKEFPSDPSGFYEKFRPTVERKDLVSKGKTFAIVERLERRLEDLDGPRRSLTERLSLYRAFHTAGLEFADAADDSYGSIGQARTDAWLTYLDIDWRNTAMEPDVYWRDLCELLIWEPYAIDHQHESVWFGAARADDVDWIEAILLDLEQEHRDALLDYEADRALQALADLREVRAR